MADFSFRLSPDATVGDIAYVVLAVQAAITPDSRFTADSSGTQGGFQYFIGHLTLTAGDLGTMAVFTYPDGFKYAGMAAVVEGTTGPDHVTFAKGVGTSLTLGSLTPSHTTDLELCLWMVNGPEAIVLPSDMSLDLLGSGAVSIAMAEKTLSSSAATGTKVASWPTSADAFGIHVLLAPSGGVAPDIFTTASTTLAP